MSSCPATCKVWVISSIILAMPGVLLLLLLLSRAALPRSPACACVRQLSYVNGGLGVSTCGIIDLGRPCKSGPDCSAVDQVVIRARRPAVPSSSLEFSPLQYFARLLEQPSREASPRCHSPALYGHAAFVPSWACGKLQETRQMVLKSDPTTLNPDTLSGHP